MKKKIAIFSENIPYPLTSGGKLAQYYYLEQLCDLFQISFYTVANNKKEVKIIKRLQDIFPNIKFHYCLNISKPKPLQQIFHKSKDVLYNYCIRFGIIQKNIQTKKTIDSFIAPKMNDKIKNFIDNIDFDDYDIVQYEFFESLAYSKLLKKYKVKKIFIHHEIRFKAARLQKIYSEEYLTDLERYEVSLLQQFDSIVVFNKNDKDLLEIYPQLKTKQITVSEFGIPSPLITRKASSTEFKRMVFIGHQFHYPNKEGLLWFLDKIYLPNIHIIKYPIEIVGRFDEVVKRRYSQYPEKIRFLGFVRDIENVYENSILICPIISGSGLRTKIIQAFANYIPVMSTSIGAEGLETPTNEHIVIFKEDNFTDKLSLLDNENLKEIANNGFSYYNTFLAKERLLKKRLIIY